MLKGIKIIDDRSKQKALYTFCFFALCLIDWAKTSLNGRMQMTATNLTGIVVALLIFSRFRIKEFIKRAYIIWMVLCIITIPIAIVYVLNYIPYRGQIFSAALNIVVYGLISIRVFSEMDRTWICNNFRVQPFILWISMLFFMLISVNESIWPAWYTIVFGLFYLTEFDDEAREALYKSLIDGVIIGFFFIQGMALLFRPYDMVRYVGLYINPNINALFYLMSYASFLCKLYWLKKNNKHWFFRALTLFFAGSMYGFCIFTGCKTVILGMLIVTIPLFILLVKYCKKKICCFVGYWICLGLICLISIPIIYGAIRYIPTIHLHPLYFEGEYDLCRIQPGEPRDSDKYISFDTAIETNLGRLIYRFPQIFESLESKLTMKVYAAGFEDAQEIETIFSEEEYDSGIDPIRLRFEIQRYYFERLNWVGHKNDYEVAHINHYYVAPHAHNVFVQMAFLYGIPAGILFVIMVLLFIPVSTQLYGCKKDFRVCVISCFVISFTVFGLFEIDWMCGQLPFTVLFLLNKAVIRK